MTEKYEDIINLPHHVSKTRPQMSMLERAAQFSPFAALNGYDVSNWVFLLFRSFAVCR